MSDLKRIDILPGFPAQAILVSGQPAPALYDNLVSECRRRSSVVLTNFFAEPVIGSQADQIDWYGALGDGEFAPWSDLSVEQQAEAAENLERTVDSLRQLQDGSDPSFDELVDAALQVPSMSDILVSDGQPFLVRWGMTEDGRVPSVSVIEQILADQQPGMTSISSAQPTNPHSARDEPFIQVNAFSTLLLSMTLTILAVTVSGLLMLQNCGLALPRFLTGGQTVLIANFCPVTDTVYNPDSELLARLEREVQARVARCETNEEHPLEPVETETDDGAITTPEFEDAINSGEVEKVLLRIYDNTQEDGDVVTVTAPGYRRTITLTNEGATFEIPLVRGEMKLFGEHDGGGGITVSVALTDGTHIVDGSMREGEQISLTIPK